VTGSTVAEDRSSVRSSPPLAIATAATTAVGTVKLAARVACALAVAVGAIALIIAAIDAGAVRHWLAYPFNGIPARPPEAIAIFLHNARAMAAIGGLLLVAQSPYWARNAAGGPVHGAIQRAGEALLAAGVAANAVVVGASLGAYRMRMVAAVLPHGPAELAAYALALALYLQGRDQPLPWHHVLAIGALSVSILALAAVLETFVSV
jgi:hypothetical protein